MEQILDFVRGVYTQHFSEICVMILGCIFVLMIMNLLAVKRCRRQVKETAKRTEGMIKMYFEQKKNIEQNTGEKRRERTGSAEQKRSRKEPCQRTGGTLRKCDPGDVSVNIFFLKMTGKKQNKKQMKCNVIKY